MKVSVETLHAIWYKLRNEYNILAVRNTSKSESILRKKCNTMLIMPSGNDKITDRAWRSSSRFTNQGSHWTEKKTSCVISAIWHIWWGYLTMGKDSFPDPSNPFHDLVAWMNTCLRGIENYGCEHCLDSAEQTSGISGKCMYIEW